MKKFIQTSFVICFLLVLAVPFVRFNTSGIISEVENRNLANRPFLIADNRINKNLFSDYSCYFDDRFGGRFHLISLNQRIEQILHKNSILYNDRAIHGKNGLWFYIDEADGDNLKDFYKKNLMNEEQLAVWKQNVKNTADWCQANGIKSIFLICPNKLSVYSEFYPFPRPKGETRSDQFIKILDELGVSYIYPRDVLLQEKKDFDYPLYYETDTHWNSAGAFIASRLLKEKIELYFPAIEFPEIEYETEVDYSMGAGDILPMIGVKESKSTQPKVKPVYFENSDFYTYEKNAGTDGVHTIGINKNLPRALIFRDSFFSALEPFISPLFSEAEYKWKRFRDEDKDYVLEYKPDIIIFESVERYSPSLAICN